MRTFSPSRGLALLLAGGLVAAGCGTTVPLSSQAPSDEGLGAQVQQTAAAGAGLPIGATEGPAGAGPQVGSASRQPAIAISQAPPASAGGSLPAAALPEKGIGWDKGSIFFGVPTEEDLSRTLGAAGISFYPGSVQGDVKAIAADLNARGGLFGRKLVPVFYDNHATDVSSNPAGSAQANCTAFTQDHRVITVLNPIAPIENDAFLQCMKKTRTPLMSIGFSTYDDSVYQRFGPNLFTTLTPNVSRFIPSYIPALGNAGFFGGWNTTTGAASRAPAVVGLLEPDTSSGHTVAALQVAALKKAGIKVGAQYFYREDTTAYGADMSSAILSFRNASVTHLLDITNVAAAVVVFAQTAQQQRYFPRYGMTSWLLPDTAASVFAQSGISQQLKGAIGIGWTPGGDVNQAHDPGKTAQQRACEQALARQGISYSGTTQRFALNTAWALCDDLNLLVAAAARGGGLSPEALRFGLESVALQPAVTFSSALSAANHSVPGSHRDLLFEAGCTCFAYHGPAHRIG